MIEWQKSCLLYISSRFPYDRQKCSMKFGTWTYDSSKVNLKFYRDIQKFDLQSYVKSNEWNIIGNNASRNTEKYGNKKKKEFYFHLKLIHDDNWIISDRLLSWNLRWFKIFHSPWTTWRILQLYSYIAVCSSVMSDVHSLLVTGKFLTSDNDRLLFTTDFQPESPSKLVLGKNLAKSD